MAALAGAVILLALLRFTSSSSGEVGNRSEFSAGSCVSTDPTDGPTHPKVVFIDAGHGGLDHGTSGTTSSGNPVLEKRAAFATAERLRTMLTAHGYMVVLSRTKDSTVAALPPSDITGTTYTLSGIHTDIRARVDCANASNADVLISIHFNAFDDPSTGGADTFYDPDRGFATQNKLLADDVQSSLIGSFAHEGWTAIPDRGVSPDTNGVGGSESSAASSYGHLYLLGPKRKDFNDHPSSMPGVLVEPLFLTDPPEADIAASAKGQAAIARGLATGIEKFIEG